MCHKLGLLKRQILWQCPKDAAITHTKFKHEIQNIGEYDFTLDKVIKSHLRTYFEYRLLKNKGSNYNKLKDKLFKYVLRAE